jgi:hypothetical protein
MKVGKLFKILKLLSMKRKNKWRFILLMILNYRTAPTLMFILEISDGVT